ncbi:MAG TPA: hypothetical protein VJ841_04470 [Candidatus Saccharimonadales bacterium]|nr:hypothetical protein [Candidatus Saccharimonadales bacterium]
MSSTDTATHDLERVTIDVGGLRIPPRSSRNPRNPSEGERQLKTFIELLRRVHLIEGTQGTVTDDGTRFSLTLRQYPTSQRLEEVSRLYIEATRRSLVFVSESTNAPTQSGRPRIDLKRITGGLLKGVIDALGDID